jgi:hypothetical protein
LWSWIGLVANMKTIMEISSLVWPYIWACEHDKGMRRVVGKKKILRLKHIFTSVGDWKIVILKIFEWILTFGICPRIIVNVLNLCRKKYIRNLGSKLGHF